MNIRMSWNLIFVFLICVSLLPHEPPTDLQTFTIRTTFLYRNILGIIYLFITHTFKPGIVTKFSLDSASTFSLL